MARQPHFPLPLPKGWPRRVRSAAVHGIALARLALITARGQANSADPGSGRISRLSEEILLMRRSSLLRRRCASRMSAWLESRPSADPTICPRSGWLSWNYGLPAAGHRLRLPSGCRSPRRPWRPGQGGSMRKGRVPWSRCRCRSTGFRSSWRTSCTVSKFSVPPWARLASPTSWLAPGCT